MNEAELLFSEILNRNRLSLYLDRNRRLSRHKSRLIASVLRKRMAGEPLAYILGKIDFMGLEFKVTPGIFIPRPETEILVEKAIDLVQSSCLAGRQARLKIHSILDIGTGSGCIAVSLAKFLKEVKITAVDVSDRALEIARQNARLNNAKVRFLKSNLFDNHELRAKNYELIISNPPYIPTEDIDNLGPEIQSEPGIALDGGKDGLDFYRRIVTYAPSYLKNNGYLALEMGFEQKDAILSLFKEQESLKIIETIKDYKNIDRAIVFKKFE